MIALSVAPGPGGESGGVATEEPLSALAPLVATGTLRAEENT